MHPIVIYYHQVLRSPRNDHTMLRGATTLDEFRTAMTVLKDEWRPLSFDEFRQIQASDKPWPKKSVLVTFDDGYKNNRWAAEILHELGMSAVFFVVSSVVNTRFQPWYLRFANALTGRKHDEFGCSWGSVNFKDQFSRRRWMKTTKEHLLSLRPAARDAALAEVAEAMGAETLDIHDPDLDFFSDADLRQLEELGMTVGAHSRTHDNLTACDAAALHEELEVGTDELQQYLRQPVRSIAYPDGRFNRSVLEIARRRFDTAFTTESRYSAPDAWQVPRRAADGVADVREVLSPMFPLKRRGINTVKRLLRF